MFADWHGKSALGAYYRRQLAKRGSPKAITATAHKLIRIFYSMLRNGAADIDQGQEYYEKQYRKRVTKKLKRRAADLGFDLVPGMESQVVFTLNYQWFIFILFKGHKD